MTICRVTEEPLLTQEVVTNVSEHVTLLDIIWSA
jgi:hypothetical protein